MDTNTARAILSEAAAGDWLKEDIPEEEQDLIKLAEYYVEEAQLALADGIDDQYIRAIIGLGSSPASPPVLSADAVHNHDGSPPGEITYLGGQENTLNKVAETYPRRSSGGFSESDLRDEGDIILEIKNTNDKPAVLEGLPVPQPVEAAYAQEMPVDLTELGDKAVRRLYSAFGSYLSRARWKLALANSNYANATHLRDEAYRSQYIKVKREAIANEEKLTIEDLQNLAKESEEYKEWNDRVNEYNAEVTNWKALVDIYGGNVERLSREWTMRTEQYERER